MKDLIDKVEGDFNGLRQTTLIREDWNKVITYIKNLENDIDMYEHKVNHLNEHTNQLEEEKEYLNNIIDSLECEIQELNGK